MVFTWKYKHHCNSIHCKWLWLWSTENCLELYMSAEHPFMKQKQLLDLGNEI